MNKNIMGVALLVGGLMMGSVANADNHDTLQTTLCTDRFQNMVDTLKLDDAQQTKIKAIKEQLKSSQMDNWKQMGVLRDQINQIVQSDSMDQTKLGMLVDQQTQLIGATMKAKLSAENQIFGVLNAEQKQQYPQILKAKEAKIKSMFEKCDD